MKPRTLSVDTPIFDLIKEIMYTWALLQAYPFLKDQAKVFDSLIPKWLALLQEELGLMRGQLEAEALTIVVDDSFDFLCMAIAATLMAEHGNDRKAPEYLRYFGSIQPYRLRRPVLGKQLDIMRTWPPALAASSSETLQHYGEQLAAQVDEADKAVLDLSEAQRKHADFKLYSRKAFVDLVNAERHALYGHLTEIPHKYPEKKLSQSFANRFFLRANHHRKPTIVETERDILRLRNQLDKKEELLAELLDKQEQEQQLRANAELEAAAKAVAEAEKARDEAQARMDEIRSRLLATETNNES